LRSGARNASGKRNSPRVERRDAMSVARVTEITASSSKSRRCPAPWNQTPANLKNVTGAWIQEQKVVVENAKIVQYRVNMKVTFVLEE
jgi:flavin-binding protein dodecin